MSSLRNLDEGRLADVDSLDSRACEFPWEEVLARLDGKPIPEDVRAELRQKCSVGLGELLRWLIRGDGTERLFLRGDLAGRRAIALAWVLRPDLFEGTPSLRELAQTLGIPISSLSRHAADVTKRWGIFNRAQVPRLKP
ncbi:MAG: hypothetical protein AB7J34_24950 [Limisphaerales bacterium]